MSARRIVIGLVLLTILVIGGVWWRATWIAGHLLHDEAPKAIAEKSGGVYRLEVGRARFYLLRRRIVVDSIQVFTNEQVNARRPRPRTSLRLAFHHCTVAGMHLFTLIAGRGLIAEAFSCAAVSAAAEVPPPPTSAGPGEPDTGAAPAAMRQAFFVLQQGLRLPRFAPRVQVARIDFPHAQLDLRLEWARKESARLELEHLEWHMTDFTVDPADSVTTSRPLFSRTVAISAANFVAHSGSEGAVRVAAFAAHLPDSTVGISGVTFAPAMSDSAFARASPYRRSLLKSSVARIALRGFDAGALVFGAGIHARRVEVDSLRVDVLSDRRRPRNPRRPLRRTPQEWIADLGRSVSVDSLLVHGGEVAYREQRPRRLEPGVLTFARLEAIAVNVRHVAGRRRSGNPTTLRATAYLQNAGRLDARFVVPLDAPRFDMSFDGGLGPMSATSLNAFIAETFALRLEKGRISEISFEARVASGVAQGSVIPRYKDLSIEVTGRGSQGILGTGGVVGDAARGIASLVGNLTALHADNPDDGETEPRRGPINHTFTPNETLPAFLWTSLRGGLMAAVRK
jgi:hypothetical protein